MRIAVIGCGGAGSQHIRTYKGIEGVELVGVCDTDTARAHKQAEATGARPYRRVDEMLTTERPDLVSVCTNEYFHVEPAIQGLQAGANVFCEKPMAHTVDEGRRMVATARTAGRVLGVDYNYRHIPAFRTLREEIDRGTFGEVLVLDISAHAFCYHHSIDLIRFLLGDVAEVCASLNDIQDRRNFPWHTPEEFLYVPSLAAAATLRMRSGATVVLTASRLRDLGDTLLNIEVVGSKGRCALRSLPVNDVRPRYVDAWPRNEGLAARFAAAPDGPTFGLNDAFQASITAFVHALESGQPVPTDGAAGVAVLEIEQAIVQAHRFGNTVRLLG